MTPVLNRMLQMRQRFIARKGVPPTRFAIPDNQVRLLAFELWGTTLVPYHLATLESDIRTNQCVFFGMRLEIQPFWGISA